MRIDFAKSEKQISVMQVEYIFFLLEDIVPIIVRTLTQSLFWGVNWKDLFWQQMSTGECMW